MDAKAVYWTAALINLGVLTGLALAGVRAIRRGDVARHRRRMQTAAALVVAFLVSYLFKLAWLGRETLALWSPAERRVLRLHELCVLVMLAAGLFALGRGRALARGLAAAPSADPKLARGHRIAGRIALVAAVFALLSSICVLAGMYARI